MLLFLTWSGCACESVHTLTICTRSAPALAGRWPCTTGLAFYLSRCVRFTNGQCCFQHPPHFGAYRRTNQRRLGRGQTSIDALTPRPPVSLSRLRLRHRNLATVSVFPCTVRNRHPHWLTVATSGLEPTVFPCTVRNPDSTGVTWLAADFLGPHHFRSRVTDRSRSPPDSRYRMIEE